MRWIHVIWCILVLLPWQRPLRLLCVQSLRGAVYSHILGTLSLHLLSFGLLRRRKPRQLFGCSLGICIQIGLALVVWFLSVVSLYSIILVPGL